MEAGLTRPLPALIFDLDGTLIDSARDIHAAANTVLAAERRDPIGFETAKGFVGHGAGVFVSRLMQAAGIAETPENHARLLAGFMAEYEEKPRLTKLYPGVRDALMRLQDRGHPMGVCTNKPAAPAKIVLDYFDLSGFFSCVVGGDTLAERKPDPRPLLYTLERLDSSSALYIGDSEVDADTARAAGAPFLLFTEGYRKTPVKDMVRQAEFSDFSALPGLVWEFASR